MKTGKWGKSGTSNFTPPRDKDEEELWIISANKQREKTPEQRIREIKRLKAIYADEGIQRKSEARKQAWEEYREQKSDDVQSQKVVFLETQKTTFEAETSPSEPDFNAEEIYNEAVERIEKSHESQMQHSAVEYIHHFTPNNI